MQPNCILFIPVSSTSGIGEYMRSIIVAKALKARWPDIHIHFILNEQVSYLTDCPYTVHTCKDSPTKALTRVNDIIVNLNPDLVIFDASGRAKQFKQAKAVGAKVAFISQHKRKRSRGLKFNRLFNTDIHWVAQPHYCIGSVSYWQKFKLALLNKKEPKIIGPVFELSDAKHQLERLKHYNLTKDTYIFFNAGSGGHKVKDVFVADIYYQAAEAFYRQNFDHETKFKCVVIFGSNYPKRLPESKNIICIKDIEHRDFITLLSNAKGCVIAAGDTLLQAIALHKTCVVAAVSPDQPARLRLCQKHRLVFAAELSPISLVAQILEMLNNEKRDMIMVNMKTLAPVKALENIVDDIASLFSTV